MDSLTIVIQLTGLLMLVPPSPGQSGPTRVLMPEPGHVRHTAVIAYRKPTGHRCPDSLVFGDFCFVRMRGWELEPLPGRAQPVDLPRSVLNLTRNSGDIPVHRNLFGVNPPRDSLRARFTIGGGNVRGICALGSWSFDPVGSAQRRTDSLANVVEWVAKVPDDSIVLVRRPLSGGPGERLVTLYPVGGEVELLIAHIPSTLFEKAQMDYIKRNRGTGRTSITQRPLLKQHLPSSEDTRIDHFESYYRLLNRAQDRRLPSLEATLPTACPVSIWVHAGLARSPTGVNCMVVAGFQ